MALFGYYSTTRKNTYNLHSQLIAYGYSAVAKQVADATGAETDMLPSSKLSEYLFYGKEQGKSINMS